ncbi:hypothetical protein RhiXN_05951 [Rhizoctonia solani]|uniref:Uncharacterized protein n=1 Tax=Rhizoctonia solani TaxID=456999 RepID=A0A8H8NY90_9AGAM|nr:uncharacterized protein RhiXN_05951 [Rhizoctonia solani]QRW20962.1 hypothetical protein RhiXN_05951 [Rhizoctonia solani]
MSCLWALDLDALRLIIGHLENDKPSLLRVMLLGKVVYSLAVPILYRSNSFDEIEEAYKFFQTLNKHSQYLGPFVQRIQLYNTYGTAQMLWSVTTNKLIHLVQKTLPLLSNLRDLRISGCEFKTSLDAHPPFYLRSLSLSLPVPASPWDFLKTQKSLKRLELRSHSTHKRQNKTDCLCIDDIRRTSLFPELNNLTACSELFVTLAPGCPITDAGDDDYWQSSELVDRNSADGPPTPPELFSELKALRLLVIEKPSRQSSIVFNSEADTLRFQAKPALRSVWSQVEAARLWKGRCTRLSSVKIYGEKLDIMAVSV